MWLLRLLVALLPLARMGGGQEGPGPQTVALLELNRLCFAHTPGRALRAPLLPPGRFKLAAAEAGLLCAEKCSQRPQCHAATLHRFPDGSQDCGLHSASSQGLARALQPRTMPGESWHAFERLPCTGTGQWLRWGPWGGCKEECRAAEGSRVRQRMCAAREGAVCLGPSTQKKSCRGREECGERTATPFVLELSRTTTPLPSTITKPPREERWGPWSTWSACAGPCGASRKTRRRGCEGEGPCRGNDRQLEGCRRAECTGPPGILGEELEWEPWSPCPKCGSGERIRHRVCKSPSLCGRLKTSPERQECKVERSCEAGWASWTPWSHCSQTCRTRGARRSRTRLCRGQGCQGRSSESSSCTTATPYCGGRGTWTLWSSWTSCLCGGSLKSRRRACETGDCLGSVRQRRFCRPPPSCGRQWAEWGEWSGCAATCGSATFKSRSRLCRGEQCPDEPQTQTRLCQGLPDCSSPWSSWSDCTASCGSGSQFRTRTCDSSHSTCRPSVARRCRNTRPCQTSPATTTSSTSTTTSLFFTTQPTSTIPCPVSWQAWSPCDCASLRRSRRRACCSPQCEGDEETKRCSCFGEWSFWGACSASCGQGTRTRSRACREGSGECRDRSQVQACRERACVESTRPPTTTTSAPRGFWSSWQVWTDCCDGNTERVRKRICFGLRCPGSDTERGSCGPGDCTAVTDFAEGFGLSFQTRAPTTTTPRPLTSPTTSSPQSTTQPWLWGSWQEWSGCGASCPLGSEGRRRLCFGAFCPDDQQEERRSCERQSCWLPWEPWSECDRTCGGGGTKKRRRNCHRGGCEGREQEVEECGRELCPLVPHWAPWTSWSDCQCSEFPPERSRRRRCFFTRFPVASGSCLGPGKDRETEDCAETCPDSTWSSWGECSASCGNGVQVARRPCRPLSSRRVCSEALEMRSRLCQGTECPQTTTLPTTTAVVSVTPGSWSGWSECSVTCGAGGVQFRRCDSCDFGESLEERPCLGSGPCGAWTAWLTWSACSRSCGLGGRRERRRACLNRSRLPVPEAECGDGREEEDEACEGLRDCGQWTAWEPWGACSRSCDHGLVTRLRRCEGGTGCTGQDVQVRVCRSPDRCGACTNCLDGPGEWGGWSECSVSCGGGTRMRSTSGGTRLEEEPCGLHPCQGRWLEWTTWSACEQTCGRGGTRDRRRACQIWRGLDCSGPRLERQLCQLPPCPEPLSFWAPWQSWSACDGPCGARTRLRACQGFRGCEGQGIHKERCGRGDGFCTPPTTREGWETWGPWTLCTASCGAGTRKRQRACFTSPLVNLCIGAFEESIECRGPECPVELGIPGEWSHWGTCSASCGLGRRLRSCRGSSCAGQASEPCGLEPCQLDGQWLGWSPWSACSSSCHGGRKYRSRRCSSESCPPGVIGEELDCAAGVACPSGGTWRLWSGWGPCSSTCGMGVRLRRRFCDGPDRCEGESSQVGSCHSASPCPLSLEYWSAWSPCSRFGCPAGRRGRVRLCTGLVCGPRTGSWEWAQCGCPGGVVLPRPLLVPRLPSPLLPLPLYPPAVRPLQLLPPPLPLLPVPRPLPLVPVYARPLRCRLPRCLGRPLRPVGLRITTTIVTRVTWEVWRPWSRCLGGCSAGLRERRRACDPCQRHYRQWDTCSAPTACFAPFT